MISLSKAKMDRKRNMHLDKTAKQVELFDQKLNDNFSDNNALINCWRQ